MAVAITTTTATRSHVEGLNGFVSMRTSIVVRHRNCGLGGQAPTTVVVTNEELRLLFARGLRLRRKWRDVMDQLRVVLVHAPDVSARTAIVREIRVLARERQIFGGIFPTRRTGRIQHVGTSSFAARTVPAQLQAILRHVARRRTTCKAEVVASDPFRQPER